MNNVVVIGKEECPWCVKVQDLLRKHDIKFVYMDVLEFPDMRTFLVNSNIQSVPQVYVDGYRVGGYEQTLAMTEELVEGLD